MIGKQALSASDIALLQLKGVLQASAEFAPGAPSFTLPSEYAKFFARKLGIPY